MTVWPGWMNTGTPFTGSMPETAWPFRLRREHYERVTLVVAHLRWFAFIGKPLLLLLAAVR